MTLTSIYRLLVPDNFRKKIYDAFLCDTLWFFRNLRPIIISRICYVFSPFLKRTEKRNAYIHIAKTGLTSYPFKTERDYSSVSIKVFFDTGRQLFYILHNGKHLFFLILFLKKKSKSYIDLFLLNKIPFLHIDM